MPISLLRQKGGVGTVLARCAGLPLTVLTEEVGRNDLATNGNEDLSANSASGAIHEE